MVHRFCHRARGVALILALLVLTLLVVIVGQLAYSTRIDLQIARNASDSQAALMAAWGGVEFAKGLLRDDLAHNEHDGAADRWARLTQAIKVGEVAVKLKIDDEDRKLNLLLLRSEHEAYVEFAAGVLERVIKEAREGVEDRSERSPAELAEDLIEWIKEGKTPGTAGEQAAAEREDGDEIPPLTLSEFLVVKGWTDLVLFGPPPAPRVQPNDDDPYGGLATPRAADRTDPTEQALDSLYGDAGREPRAVADFLTLWSTGRININTVEPMMLAALSENMNEDIVRAWVAKRSSAGEGEDDAAAPAGTSAGDSDTARELTDNSFTEVNALREVEGMESSGEGGESLFGQLSPYLTVQSHTFKVTASADVGRVRRSVEVVIRRQKSGFRVLWYKER